MSESESGQEYPGTIDARAKWPELGLWSMSAAWGGLPLLAYWGDKPVTFSCPLFFEVKRTKLRCPPGPQIQPLTQIFAPLPLHALQKINSTKLVFSIPFY